MYMYDCFPQGWINIYLFPCMYIHVHVCLSLTWVWTSICYIYYEWCDRPKLKKVKLWITLYMYIVHVYENCFLMCLEIGLNYYTVSFWNWFHKRYSHTDRTNHLHVIPCTCTCIYAHTCILHRVMKYSIQHVILCKFMFIIIYYKHLTLVIIIYS